MFLMNEFTQGRAYQLLQQIAQGQAFTTEERLRAAGDVLACSTRDWSTDPEAWLLYQVVLNKPGAQIMEPSME